MAELNLALSADQLQEPVTRHMRTDFVQLGAHLTVQEALEEIQRSQPQGRIIYFYVVDDQSRLCGVVPTRRLLLSPRTQRLSEIMVDRVVAIPHTATVLEACEFFLLNQLLAFPIVDDTGKMIGLVDVDLYTRELSDLERREENQDLFQLIGVHWTETQQRSGWLAFTHRFPWLLANIAGGLLAAVISDWYQQVATLILVVPFIPVVLALAESVTIQSVSLAIQTLHGPKPRWSILVPKLRREAITGSLLGLACGSLVGMVALVWKGSWWGSWSLLGGIGGSILAAALIGVLIPYLLHLLKRDPQLAAGPIALALTDMATLLIYFTLAGWLLLS